VLTGREPGEADVGASAEVDNPYFMARRSLSSGFLAMAVLMLAWPAAAQFGSIFGDRPPRPPGNVPSAPPIDDRGAPPPRYYPGGNPPPINTDEPPAAPQPPPMALPPQNRPGAVQSQPLAPPPGTAPPAQQADQPPPSGPPRQTEGPPRAPDGTQQQQQQQQPPVDANAPVAKEVVEEPPPQRITNPTAVFAGLDKITGRITSFDVAIDETVQFGALQVTPRVCYSRPPTETPQTDSFVEVDEVTLKGEIKRIFTGWMFAASPGLHAVEHPIYDVWLTDCKGGKLPAVAEAPQDDQQAAPPTPPPTPRRAPRRQQQPLRGGFVR
jgi:hypothetical protein